MINRFVIRGLSAVPLVTAMLGLVGPASLIEPAAAAETNQPSAAQIKFFEEEVRPIFVNNCYDCHSADSKIAGGLRVDDHAGILKGGDTGAAVVPGDPGKSLIINRINQTNPKRRMPKGDDPLTADEINILTTWIKDGAVWSDQNVPASVAQARKPKFIEATLTAADASPAPGADQVEFFEKKIRPIFVSHCYNCHSADTKNARGLRVDDL